MGVTLLSLLVKLGLDTSNYDEGIDRSQHKAQSLSHNLAKVGSLAVLGGIAAVGASAAALGGFLASTIQPASDLGETMNKVGVIFGDSSGEIQNFVDQIGAGLGQSSQQMYDAAATFGVFGKSAGLANEDLANFSTDLVTLSSDLASFYNTSPEEAIMAIGAALRGESEPIRKYGVLLDDATLRQKALELGIVKTTKTALTPQQRVLAANAVIMQQTADAQGDFMRTSDGLANSQRIITAQFKNMKTQIGAALLPAVQTLAKSLSGLFQNKAFQDGLKRFIDGLAQLSTKFIEALPQIVGFFQKAFGWLMENQGVIIGVLAAVGAAIAVFVYTTVIPALVAFLVAAAPVIAVMALVGVAAYLLYQAWTNNWGGIQEKVGAVWAFLQPIFAAVVAWFQTNIPVAIAALVAFWEGTLLPAFQAIAAWLSENIPVAIAALVAFWNGTLLPALQAAWTWINDNLVPLFAAIGELIGTVVVLAVTILAGVWQNVLLPALQTAGEWIGANLLPILSDLGGIVQDVAGWVGGVLKNAFDGISKAIQKVVDWIGTLTQSLQNITLPDWMTPGSPTPWEIGLKGISKAMRSLARTELPELEAGLRLTQPAGVLGVNGESAPAQVTYNIFTRDNPGQVQQALTLSALMGGAR